MENNLQDAVVAAKDKMPEITPVPPEFHSQATAYELKSRLNWGEPGLTIVDIRDHDTFNECRIMGAITLPLPDALEMAKQALLPGRDIYVYGNSDELEFRLIGKEKQPNPTVWLLNGHVASIMIDHD
ncbi:rhodanese-like domain-containing protein [Egbenema bharatensis]|uniref:rhodanese-like domain-containing protein n=1 Tax=Egbenema bharatensis TaxID=3463334 RepID=UPI003A88D652